MQQHGAVPGSEGSVPPTFLPPTPSDVLLVKTLCSRAMGLQRVQLGARLHDAGGRRLVPGAGSSALSRWQTFFFLSFPPWRVVSDLSRRFSYGMEAQHVSWWLFVAKGMELGAQAWWLGDTGGTCPGHAAARCHLPGLEEPLFLLRPHTRVLPGSGHPSHSAVGRSRSPAEICSASSPAKPFL